MKTKLLNLLILFCLGMTSAAFADQQGGNGPGSNLDFPLRPKAHIRFYCSQPSLGSNDLMVTDGTDTKVIQQGMTNWVDGMPQPGCTQRTVAEITQNGYFCDGHFLGDYKGDPEVQEGDVATCESARAAQPSLTWN